MVVDFGKQICAIIRPNDSMPIARIFKRGGSFGWSLNEVFLLTEHITPASRTIAECGFEKLAEAQFNAMKWIITNTKVEASSLALQKLVDGNLPKQPYTKDRMPKKFRPKFISTVREIGNVKSLFS
jgi:hypothetical protein